MICHVRSKCKFKFKRKFKIKFKFKFKHKFGKLKLEKLKFKLRFRFSFKFEVNFKLPDTWWGTIHGGEPPHTWRGARIHGGLAGQPDFQQNSSLARPTCMWAPDHAWWGEMYGFPPTGMRYQVSRYQVSDIISENRHEHLPVMVCPKSENSVQGTTIIESMTQ